MIRQKYTKTIECKNILVKKKLKNEKNEIKYNTLNKHANEQIELVLP
jgi:hypothetical protein